MKLKQKPKHIALYKIILMLGVVGFPFFGTLVGSLFHGTFGIAAIVIMAIPCIYWAPSIYSMVTNAPNFLIVFGMNLLFAWTGIGWVVCMMTVALDLRNNVIKVPAFNSRQAVAAR